MTLRIRSISIESTRRARRIASTPPQSAERTFGCLVSQSTTPVPRFQSVSTFPQASKSNSATFASTSVRPSPSNASLLFDTSKPFTSSHQPDQHARLVFAVTSSPIGGSTATAAFAPRQPHNDSPFRFNRLSSITHGMSTPVTSSGCPCAVFSRDILGLGEATRADLTAADNYIQHLLWLISPEYRGEPGYRHYTIAMILIFIGITVAVLHAMLFGIVFPF